MTFREFINILGICNSQFKSHQIKIVWIDEYFPRWEMEVITDEGTGIVKRYRDEDGKFDGTVELKDSRFYNIDINMDKITVVINNYNTFFESVFEDESFQTNFKNSILE